jgi:hypothetical protein
MMFFDEASALFLPDGRREVPCRALERFKQLGLQLLRNGKFGIGVDEGQEVIFQIGKPKLGRTCHGSASLVIAEFEMGRRHNRILLDAVLIGKHPDNGNDKSLRRRQQ